MPDLHGYTEAALDGLTTTTASGVAIYVRVRDTGIAVCDIRLTRAELRELLARADLLASLEDTVLLAPVPKVAIAG